MKVAGSKPKIWYTLEIIYGPHNNQQIPISHIGIILKLTWYDVPKTISSFLNDSIQKIRKKPKLKWLKILNEIIKADLTVKFKRGSILLAFLD